MNRSSLIGAVCVAFIAGASCASRQVIPQEIVYRNVEVVTVGTPGVQIEAADSTFAFDSEGAFQTPFVVSSCPENPTTDSLDAVIAAGGQSVRVTHPDSGEPLYGVLAFCPISEAVTGPASRSYLVQVPSTYVAATSDNRVSVVYEPIATGLCTNTCRFADDNECDDGGPASLYSVCDFGTDCNDCGPRGGGGTSAWILYLSQIPL